MVLTSEGMPAVVVGGERYPLFFSTAAIKRFAEHKGLTFKQMLDQGWNVAEQDDDDMRTLLSAALVSAEKRRAMFEGGPERTIDEVLIEAMLEVLHPGEIWTLILTAWNNVPRQPGEAGDGQDPQRGPAETSDGQPSFD